MEIYTGEAGSPEKTFYTHGQGTDEHLALERNGQFYYYHADGLGSITAVTDQGKAIAQSYQYDSFGINKPTTNFRNSYTYTGREWDKEVGLYYYNARYYDPMEGRFVSKDPIGFDGGDVNLYAYVQNNPINLTDPSGLSPQCKIDPCKILREAFKKAKGKAKAAAGIAVLLCELWTGESGPKAPTPPSPRPPGRSGPKDPKGSI